MGDIIRKLIRWIIFIILVVLLILLIVKLANKNGTAKKTKKVLDKGVTEIKKGTKKATTKDKDTTKKEEVKKEETKKEDNNTITSTIEVNAPDTGSNSYLYILGIAILGTGTYYIYRNKELED